jgi:hypothetical protein
MRNISSVTHHDDEPQGQSDPRVNNGAVKEGTSLETLEIKISNRAHEISQREGGHTDQSLASWLEAAREILSEGPERAY